MIHTGLIGGPLADRLLRRLTQRALTNTWCDGSAYEGRSKLETLLGHHIWTSIAGKTVIDFGCGAGAESIEMALRGAARVIGLDILEGALESARRAAVSADVADRCIFARDTEERADAVVSLDGFEHFDEPGAVLGRMYEIVKPGGRVFISFGPPWLHPLGGHLFSVFPWAHLVFTEQALIRWRSTFKHDGATRFSEVEGGLNQMTLRRFRQLIARSRFELRDFEAVPIRRLRHLSNPITREFLTSCVRCTLRRPLA